MNETERLRRASQYVSLVNRAIQRIRDEPVRDARVPHLKALIENLAILNNLLIPVLSNHACTQSAATVCGGRGREACA